ncbi:MAG: cyclase/dehydrase [Gloeocapsa sp. DLM2.Bin57]|nr:MAG: cyclase/dehydrase [Gloeocapsa sp. DLM2.Bin57]
MFKTFKILSLAVVFQFLYLFTPAQATPTLERVLLQLTAQERAALQDNQIAVVGQTREYRGRFLVKASAEEAWEVLTDYQNYPNFLPDVVSIQIQETDGNKTVFEQVQRTSVLIFNRETSLTIAVAETPFTKINFSLVEGGVSELQGTWEVTPIIIGDESTPSQVLVTHTVTVTPDTGVPENIFYSIYRDSLRNSLEAMKTEIENRATAR